MRRYIESLLKDEFSIETAVNGKDALEKIISFKPDLVLSDVMMPVMNGYELVKNIKADPSMKMLPVILLTAKADLDYKVQGLEYGADDYLGKPFEYRELIARIRSLLRIRDYQKVLYERNRVIESELDIARLIQSGLMKDSTPHVSGFSLGSLYLPMDKVGGDFFIVRQSNGILRFLIADVSGHGIPGALLATITRIVFDYSSTMTGGAAGFMGEMDNVISGNSVQSMFATAVFGTLGSGDLKLNYCNAGHCLPIVHRRASGGAIIDLKKRNPPAGIGMGISYHDDIFQLVKGDRLVLYTDGVTEVARPEGEDYGEEYGEERLYDLIRENSSISPQALAEKIGATIDEYSGRSERQDDISILIIDIDRS